MAGAVINVHWDDRAAQAMFARLIGAGTNLRPLFDEIGSALEHSTRGRFKTEAAPDGTPWAPLSEVTKTRKAARGGNPGILKDRGDLLLSIRWEAGADFVQIIAGPTEYAATHQFGRADNTMFGGPSAPVPARPYLGLSPQDEAEIVDAVSALLGRAAGG